MTDIIVCGAEGRMGRKIIEVINEIEGLNLVGAVEAADHSSLGKNVKKNIPITSKLKKVLKDKAVVVDFTTPSATLEHLHNVAEGGVDVSFIIGTTGFTKKEEEEIRKMSTNTPIVLSHNYGIGMNIFWHLIREAANLLKDFDIEIVEFHGREKKDAPSGTAHTIAGVIAEEKKLDLSRNLIFERRGFNKKGREKCQIGMHSIRGGNYKSNHMVFFCGDGETIEFVHREESLIILVKGVIESIKFVVKAGPGLYGMKDVLKINQV